MLPFLLLLLAGLAAGPVWAADCPCDPSQPETLELRQCSLCREAEKQPREVEVFFLKDANPRKPNRMLALPRTHQPGNHPLSELDPKLRARLWEAAIAKARELWGEEWGVAYNGESVRTQCHAHIHIGKLLKGVEEGRFVVVDQASEIPLAPGEGVWIHPDGRRMHVHLGEQICETVLER